MTRTVTDQAHRSFSIGELPSWLRPDPQLHLNGRPAATTGHPNDNVEQTQDTELIADVLGTKVTDRFADGGVLLLADRLSDLDGGKTS